MLFPSRPSTSRNSASQGGLSSIPHSVAGAARRIGAGVFDARSSPIDSRSVISEKSNGGPGRQQPAGFLHALGFHFRLRTQFISQSDQPTPAAPLQNGLTLYFGIGLRMYKVRNQTCESENWQAKRESTSNRYASTSGSEFCASHCGRRPDIAFTRKGMWTISASSSSVRSWGSR